MKWLHEQPNSRYQTPQRPDRPTMSSSLQFGNQLLQRLPSLRVVLKRRFPSQEERYVPPMKLQRTVDMLSASHQLSPRSDTSTSVGTANRDEMDNYEASGYVRRNYQPVSWAPWAPPPEKSPKSVSPPVSAANLPESKECMSDTPTSPLKTDDEMLLSLDVSPAVRLIYTKGLLVRERLSFHRNGEVDWATTFFRQGFEPGSIFTYICKPRKGRWNAEEVEYSVLLIQLIDLGVIQLERGSSVREFLSKKLHSNPMRVLKKLSNCPSFRFLKKVSPTLSTRESVDVSLPDAESHLQELCRLRMEFLRSVQIEAIIAAKQHLPHHTLCTLLVAQCRSSAINRS